LKFNKTPTGTTIIDAAVAVPPSTHEGAVVLSQLTVEAVAVFESGSTIVQVCAQAHTEKSRRKKRSANLPILFKVYHSQRSLKYSKTPNSKLIFKCLKTVKIKGLSSIPHNLVFFAFIYNRLRFLP
jgi:hypothetical protein